jgi:hypothetical protein
MCLLYNKLGSLRALRKLLWLLLPQLLLLLLLR